MQGICWDRPGETAAYFHLQRQEWFYARHNEDCLMSHANENLDYFLLTCMVLAIAVGINSTSVYAQKRFRFYDRHKNGWLWHSLTILPAWVVFVYLLINVNSHYELRFDSLPTIGYVLYTLAILFFGLAMHKIGWKSLLNGNWFGRGKVARSGIFKYLKNPIYDSYFLAFAGAAFASSNAAYFIIALESYIGLNVIQSRVEQLNKGKL